MSASHLTKAGSTAIAIMQGRLSPPVNGQLQAFPAETWAQEFALAADAGLDAIEWIFDATSNPLLSDREVGRVRQIARETGIAIRSVCADYFMDAPLHRGIDAEVDARLEVFRALVDRVSEVGARHIVLPCVDQSAVRDDYDRDRLIEVLEGIVSHTDARGVEVHLETSLAPSAFAALLARLPGTVMANYDSGNSASLGYDVHEEFAAYGDRVGSVHIKDRRRGASTVPLGTGDADFPALFGALARVGFRGLFTLQVARGDLGREIDLARSNRDFVLRQLRAAGGQS